MRRGVKHLHGSKGMTQMDRLEDFRAEVRHVERKATTDFTEANVSKAEAKRARRQLRNLALSGQEPNPPAA